MWQCFQSPEFLSWASLTFPKSGSRDDALMCRRTIRNTFVGITNGLTEIKKLHRHIWQWDPISLLCNVHFWTGQARDQSTNLYKRRGTLSCDGPWFFRKLFLSWDRRKIPLQFQPLWGIHVLFLVLFFLAMTEHEFHLLHSNINTRICN